MPRALAFAMPAMAAKSAPLIGLMMRSLNPVGFLEDLDLGPGAHPETARAKATVAMRA